LSAAAAKPRLPIGEFVAIMALLTSLIALSIDAMLPALPDIGVSLQVARANDTALVISMLFLGLAAGQLVYGPLSDSIGRRPVVQAGLVLFMIGSLLSMLAGSFELMLAGRVLQGLGAAGPRIVTIAMVRDQYEGRAMARIMSFVMTLFIMVPALAPSLGQAVLLVADWRAIFGIFLVLGVIGLAWFSLRQPETHPPERRRPLSLRSIARGVRETCSNRAALGHTLAASLIFGAFVGYLTTTQQLFQGLYGVGKLFPLYFGVLALAIGGASFSNAKLVMRLGMALLSNCAVIGLCLLSLGFGVVALVQAGAPPLWGLMVYLLLAFFCVGILFGNLQALAMEPLGHIAGVGAAVVGSITTILSLVFGTAIGQAYDGTVLPLVGGFALLALLALPLLRWAGR